MRGKGTTLALLIVMLAGSAGLTAAAEPPELINYQGVLRDDQDKPIDGTREMIFRFYDTAGDVSCNGGTLLLTDSHETAGTGSVEITEGMFNVQIGSGVITAGTASTLTEVFRDHDPVWAEVTVGGEKLCPRIRVASAAYSLNADHLDGKDSSGFIDTSTSPQSKSGPFSVIMSGTPYGYAVQGVGGLLAGGHFQVDDLSSSVNVGADDWAVKGWGNGGGADLWDINDSGWAKVAAGHLGIDAGGNTAGGYFHDSDSSAWALVAVADRGIEAKGNAEGGYFEDLNSSGRAWIAEGDTGIRADGNSFGGSFSDRDGSGYAHVGTGDWGIFARGNTAGGYFEDIDSSGAASVATGDTGISAQGNNVGGYFLDADSSGWAYVGVSDRGIEAKGNSEGAYFEDLDDSGRAWLAEGNNGIRADGNVMGGDFSDSNGSGYAWAGYGDQGIHAQGNTTGGYFKDRDGTGYTYAGYADQGIHAQGNVAGGYFKDADGTGYAYVGYGAEGIHAQGNTAGGFFKDFNSGGWSWVGRSTKGIEAHGTNMGGDFYDDDGSGYAYLAYGDQGLQSFGNEMGGYFEDLNSSAWLNVAWSSFKISGSGSVSFVQNHPESPGEVIVYTAPEGDEVATYTRGSGLLVAGEARVALGETFKWVTNPDVGLTAHVTPRGSWADLYVAALTTEELIVRSREPGATGVAFDFVVYGLRIGFEEASVVREKDRESWIPSMKDHRDLYQRRPDLKRFNALERFKRQAAEVRGVATEALDFSRADALRAAVQEYDPAVHGPLAASLRKEALLADAGDSGSLGAGVGMDEGIGGEPGVAEPIAEGRSVVPGRVAGARRGAQVGLVPADDEGNVYARSFRPSATDLASLIGVSEPVEAGDVLVIDPDAPGQMRLARDESDTAVFGIVASEPGVVLGVEPPPAAEESVDATDEGIGEDLEAATSTAVAGSVRHVPVALSGVALCKVDAGYGSIIPGDLLTTSPTQGHAMRSDDPLPGTILGKALEPLDAGTGLIKVLVMLR